VAIIKEGSIINVQDIKTLQSENYKKIRVDAEGIQGKRFDVDGVTQMTKENGSVTFFFRGDINAIMKLISAQKVSDVIIEEPTLEEIFMHYYE